VHISLFTFHTFHTVEDLVAHICDMYFIVLTTGGAESRQTWRGCQLRQPHNLWII